eukprot:TRINITY_DN22712_c0_g1_i1.p1 TRINITY_DN22712_c0_g1~~TRINITY_DN22712_c0_g1_i1.p1  ORF type:complete len:275 (-),score=32.52 TRINITY_DN22712_c0_g1_i1:167-949(-)
MTFVILIPFAGAYFLVYAVWIKRLPDWQSVNAAESTPKDETERLIVNESSADILEDAATTDCEDCDEEYLADLIRETGEGRWMRYLRCTKIIWWNALQLMLVYIFEYVASTGAADKANKNYDNDSNSSADHLPWQTKHAFVILSFCYQIGVFVSRSSLSLFHIRRVEILTVLQLLNCVLWLLEVQYHFLNLWVQFGLMVFVGLLGGAMYVNVFYLLLHDSKIPEADRELCVNLTALAITVGITIAALFILMMDNTFFKDK